MRGITVIKIGGRPLAGAESLMLLTAELARLAESVPTVLVHGGGSEVTRISRVFGLEPRFDNGIRQTTPEEMAVVEMVLAGRMNTMLVRSLVAASVRAVGLTACDAGLLSAEPLSPESRTGRVTGSDGGLLDDLLQRGYLPVCSSVAMDSGGEALNINADEAALELPAAIRAERLVFLSDVPGIRLGEGIASRLDRNRAEAGIEKGEIDGGMIPKVRSSFAGLSRGIGEVVIGGCDAPGDLARLLAGGGTHLIAEEKE